MADEAIYGLRLKVQFQGPLYAATVAQLLAGLDLVRLGLTMTDQVEAEMRKERFFHPRLGPWWPGPWDDAEIILRSAEYLRAYGSKGPFPGAYKAALWPAIAVTQFRSELLRGGKPQSIMVQSITAGSLESVIADAVESVIDHIRDLFRHISTRIKRREYDAPSLFEFPNPAGSAGSELGKSAVILGQAAVLSTVIDLESTDIEVEGVDPEQLHLGE